MPGITWITPIAVILLLWSLLRVLPAGADGRAPFPYLISLGHLLWIPLVIVAVVAVASHDPVSAGLAMATAIGIGINSLLTYRPWRRPQPPMPTTFNGSADAAKTITVMTLNCRRGLADAGSVVGAVRERGVQVLALQELTDDAVAALSAAGLDALLPHHQSGVQHRDDNGGFNAIWSLARPVSSRSDAVAISAAETPCISLRMGPQTVRFVSAHTKSPQRGCREWSRGIIGLGVLASEPASSEPAASEPAASEPVVSDTTASDSAVSDSAAPNPSDRGNAGSRRRSRTGTVLMGDLNSSPDHPSFRALLDQGFHDAGLSIARRPVASFPSWMPWPRLDIDHILLTKGIEALHITSFPVPGTDHLAVCATLRVEAYPPEAATDTPITPADAGANDGLALSSR